MYAAGYGTPSGPGGYQGWGAPPGPQGQQMPPPQWGSNYGGPPQQQGYGSYGKWYIFNGIGVLFWWDIMKLSW